MITGFQPSTVRNWFHQVTSWPLPNLWLPAVLPPSLPLPLLRRQVLLARPVDRCSEWNVFKVETSSQYFVLGDQWFRKVVAYMYITIELKWLYNALYDVLYLIVYIYSRFFLILYCLSHHEILGIYSTCNIVVIKKHHPLEFNTTSLLICTAALRISSLSSPVFLSL